jgi:hypothetical protein
VKVLTRVAVGTVTATVLSSKIELLITTLAVLDPTNK